MIHDKQNNLKRLILTKSYTPLFLHFNYGWYKFYSLLKLNKGNKLKCSNNLYNKKNRATKNNYPEYLESKLTQKYISTYYNLKVLKRIYFVKFNINKKLFKSKWLLENRFILNNTTRSMNYEKKNKYG